MYLRRFGLIFAVAVISPLALCAQTTDPSGDLPLESAAIAEDESYLPGISLATGISEITGVAISPLLGVSGVGIWTYFRTAPELRENLPWYCDPLAWGISLFVLALCFFKDTLGTILPPFFKKPLDLLELFENKASALIASAAFVPFVANQIAVQLAASPSPTAVKSALTADLFVAQAPSLAAISMSLDWVLIPLSLIGFFLVWIVSHAINILILLSPFGLLDTALKAARLGLLSLIAVLYAIDPILAAVLSGIVIVVAAFLAPSAFRLTVFGTIMGTDYFRSLVWKEAESDVVRGFLAKRGGKLLKARSFGALQKGGHGKLLFESRFLFKGPKRTLTLPGPDFLAIANGLLFPSLLQTDAEPGKRQCLLYLLPRHRHEIHRISEELGLGEVRETTLNRGFAAMKSWLKEMVNLRRGSRLSQRSEEGGDGS